RVYFEGADGAGLVLDNTYMARLDQCLFRACGSATEPTLVVDNSTTFKWDQSRISGANDDSIAGVMVDDTNGALFVGGAIESTKGVPLSISSKASRTAGCLNLDIVGLDIENPGDG